MLLLALHALVASVHAGEPPRFMAGPQSRKAPDNLEAELLEFLDGACCSLDILVQEWDNRALAERVIERARGTATSPKRVKVRAVLESDYLVARPESPEQDPGDSDSSGALPPDSIEPNRLIVLDFWRAGIDARLDYNPAIFHHKFVVRDYGKPTEAVWTGSMNFTETDARLNLNNAVILTEPHAVKAYRDKFREAWSGAFGKRVRRSARSPEPFPSGDGGSMRVMFTPNDDLESELVQLIGRAEKEIRFAIFTFSQSSALADAIADAVRRGVKCYGVFDGGQASQSWSPDERLEAAGCRIERIPPPGKVHHKFLVVDGRWLSTGSFNFTRPANEANDENAVLTDSPALVEAALREHRRMMGGRAKVSRRK